MHALPQLYNHNEQVQIYILAETAVMAGIFSSAFFKLFFCSRGTCKGEVIWLDEFKVRVDSIANDAKSLFLPTSFCSCRLIALT